MAARWICSQCGYIYRKDKGDPSQNIAPGTDFNDLPNDWLCPNCHKGLEYFDFRDGN